MPRETVPPTPLIAPQLITVQNAANITKIGDLAYRLGLINSLAWRPDGKLLAISTGNEVALFSVDGSNLTRLASLPHKALIPSLAFSPDGQWLATGSRDGKVRVWQVKSLTSQSSSPTPTWEAEGHQKGVNSVIFSPDGKWLASGGNDAIARLWNPSSGEALGMLIGGTFAVPSIIFSPDSKTLAIANGEYIRLRDPESESITGTLLSELPIYTLEYSPDGDKLAAGDISNGIQIWDPSLAFRTGSETYPPPLKMTGHSARPTSYRALIWDIAFNPDGTLLASAGGDQTVRLWDVASGNLLATLTGHEDAVTSLSFSPDGTILVSGGLDGQLLLWGIP
jgi:WD40 repeat protein